MKGRFQIGTGHHQNFGGRVMMFLNMGLETSLTRSESWPSLAAIKLFGSFADNPKAVSLHPLASMATFDVRDQRPNAARDFVTGRYHLCLAMVHQMLEPARTLHFEQNIREDHVLLQCYQHLLDGVSDLSQREAAWVVRRMADTLDWDCPALPLPRPYS